MILLKQARLWHLVVITLPQPFAMNIILPGLHEIGQAFERSSAQASAFITTFVLGMALGHLTLSALSDKVGRRPVLLAGLLGFSFTTLLASLTASDMLMLGLRFLQGLSSVAGLAMARAMLRDTRPLSEVTSGMALLLLGMSLGPIVAPLLGGFLIEAGPWQWLFWTMFALNCPAFWIAWQYCPETCPPRSGNVLKITAANMTSLLSDQSFRSLLVLPFLSGMMYFLMILGVTQIGNQSFDLSPSQISLVYLLIALGTMLGAATAARLVLKRGALKAGFCALGLTLAGALLSVFLANGGAILFFLAYSFVQMGVAMFMPVSMGLVTQVSADKVGTASGLGAGVQMGAGAVMTALLGLSLWAFPSVLAAHWIVVGILCASSLSLLQLKRITRWIVK